MNAQRLFPQLQPNQSNERGQGLPEDAEKPSACRTRAFEEGSPRPLLSSLCLHLDGVREGVGEGEAGDSEAVD